MITINSIAKTIEDGLNLSAKAYQFKFKIFVDAGQFKKALKTRTEKTLFINSLLRVGDSSITPVQGITIANQSAVLEVCVPIFKEEQIDEVTTLFRNMLDGYFATYKVQSIDGYTVSSTYSLASTGTLEPRGVIGPSLTFYVNMDFAYIENGLNSANCKFTLDGFDLPYTAAKITKNPVAQSDALSNLGGKGTTVNTSFVRSFDFQIPAQSGNGGIGAIIMSEIKGGGLNTPHTLVVDMSGTQDTYNVVFGQTDISLEGINNAGFSISLVERAE